MVAILEPWTWDESYLSSLVQDQVQENFQLDYKGARSISKSNLRRAESVSKDVSVFANSAGGTIVYGISEQSDHRFPKELEGCDPADPSRETLEQLIIHDIQPRIDGFRITEVQLPQTQPGRVAYVVYAPQSERAPHQAADKRYYKRYECTSVPMEDYEVRDVLGRQRSPSLRIHIEGMQPTYPLTFGENSERSQPLSFPFIVTNEAFEPAQYALLNVYIDSNLGGNHAQGVGGQVRLASGETIVCNCLSIEWRGNLRLPIFRGPRMRLTEATVTIDSNRPEYYVLWETHASRMPVKQGGWRFSYSDARSLLAVQPIDVQFKTLDFVYRI